LQDELSSDHDDEVEWGRGPTLPRVGARMVASWHEGDMNRSEFWTAAFGEEETLPKVWAVVSEAVARCAICDRKLG